MKNITKVFLCLAIISMFAMGLVGTSTAYIIAMPVPQLPEAALENMPPDNVPDIQNVIYFYPHGPGIQPM